MKIDIFMDYYALHIIVRRKMVLYFSVPVVLSFICVVKTAPQTPEINDQFEKPNHTEVFSTKNEENMTETNLTNTIDEIKVTEPKKEVINTTVPAAVVKIERNGFTTKLYNAITCPVVKLISVPRVNRVIRNIGTCIVNGAMELIFFYFPAPLIPLIASAAGLFIPFEPVVLLKEKMPVTSYRRAFKTAVDGFLGTFDRYKMQDENDPYMTNTFNRRFMGNSKELKDKGKGENDK